MAAPTVEAGATIWGIDYEFIFSLPMHLDVLAEEAETGCEPRGDERVLARIDVMLESNAIYAPYVREEGSFPESNGRRENLMKEQLIDDPREWETG